MKRSARFFAAILFGRCMRAATFFCGWSARWEAKNAAPHFVSTQWVAEHLKDPSLVLLAVGEKSEYDGGHIPGARNFDYDRVSTPHGSGLMLELPPVEELVKVFEDVGVSDSSRVVVYFSSEWVTPTARVYLTLDYLGLRERVSYLDGGMAAWRKEGRAVSTEKPKFAKGTFDGASAKRCGGESGRGAARFAQGGGRDCGCARG